MGHAYLPEKQPYGDYLGVLKKDDHECEDNNRYYYDFWFHVLVFPFPLTLTFLNTLHQLGNKCANAQLEILSCHVSILPFNRATPLPHWEKGGKGKLLTTGL